jgi:hypothetical protein
MNRKTYYAAKMGSEIVHSYIVKDEEGRGIIEQ